jgi:putative ABC transport system ATP-binding protein
MIELTNVTKTYGKTQILKQINLTVKQAEFVSIRGKSGVGKSTLLKTIALLDTPDQGQVKLLGKETIKMNDNEKSNLRLQNIGFIFQFSNLISSLTVQENIELPLALAKTDKTRRKQRTQELINYFQLEQLANRFPQTLSGGERQRIAAIRALANHPKILIADEPTSSIDDENTTLLLNLLQQINQQEKVTIILTTTDLQEPLPTTTNYLLKEAQLHEQPSP